jgi:hypothetical protein
MPDSETSRLNVLLGKSLPAVLCGFAFLSVCFPVTNTDIWWHLAAGRWILEQGAFPDIDPFAAGTLGREWIDVHWLFQVIAYAVHSAGGPLGLVLIKCLLFAAAAFFLLKAAEVSTASRFRPLIVAWLCLLMVAGQSWVFARPIVFSLVFIGVFLWVLERFKKDGRLFPLILLPLIQLLWSNTQALSVLGPVIFLCYMVGEGLSHLAVRMRIHGFEAEHNLPATALARLLRVFALVGIACLLTPYGLSALGLPFKLLGRIDPVYGQLFSQNVSENLPPWILERAGAHPVGYFKWIAVATFASFLLQLKRISPSRLLLTGAAFFLALLANRNVLLFYQVAGPVTMINVCAAAAERFKTRRPRFSARALESPLLAIAVVGALGLQLGITAKHDGSVARVSPFTTPKESAEILRKQPEGGRLFNSVRYGGYLIWALHPGWQPIIDGRLVIRSAKQFSDYLRVVDQPERFSAYHHNYRFRAVILPAATTDRYRKLIRHLYNDPEWSLAYTDGTQVLFLPKESTASIDLSSKKTVDEILTQLDARYESNPRVTRRAVYHLGSLLFLLGHYQRAEAILSGLLLPEARPLLARCHYHRGQLAEARALSLEVLAETGDAIDSLNLLALIALEEANFARALELIEKVLRLDPHNPEARQILEGMHGRPTP